MTADVLVKYAWLTEAIHFFSWHLCRKAILAYAIMHRQMVYFYVHAMYFTTNILVVKILRLS